MPPVWLLFLLVGAARSAEATYVRAQQFDAYTLDLLKWLLSISLLGLFAPRLLALARALIRSRSGASGLGAQAGARRPGRGVPVRPLCLRS